MGFSAEKRTRFHGIVFGAAVVRSSLEQEEVVALHLSTHNLFSSVLMLMLIYNYTTRQLLQSLSIYESRTLSRERKGGEGPRWALGYSQPVCLVGFILFSPFAILNFSFNAFSEREKERGSSTKWGSLSFFPTQSFIFPLEETENFQFCKKMKLPNRVTVNFSI